MLQLYPARTRRLCLFQSTEVRRDSFATEPIDKFFEKNVIILSESMTVAEALAAFSSNISVFDAIVYSDSKQLVGVLRRDSITQIEKEDRFEAMALPISSLVTRSHVIVDRKSSWREVVSEVEDARALSIVVRSASDGEDYFSATVDTLLKKVTELIFEEHHLASDQEATQSAKQSVKTMYQSVRQ